jgi:hypothetical protein
MASSNILSLATIHNEFHGKDVVMFLLELLIQELLKILKAGRQGLKQVYLYKYV